MDFGWTFDLPGTNIDETLRLYLRSAGLPDAIECLSLEQRGALVYDIIKSNKEPGYWKPISAGTGGALTQLFAQPQETRFKKLKGRVIEISGPFDVWGMSERIVNAFDLSDGAPDNVLKEYKNSSPVLPKINYANISSNNQITPPSSPGSDIQFSDDGHSVVSTRETQFTDVSEFPLPDDIYSEPAPEPEPTPIVQASTTSGGETVTRRKPTPAPRMLKPNSMYLPPPPPSGAPLHQQHHSRHNSGSSTYSISPEAAGVVPQLFAQPAAQAMPPPVQSPPRIESAKKLKGHVIEISGPIQFKHVSGDMTRDMTKNAFDLSDGAPDNVLKKYMIEQGIAEEDLRGMSKQEVVKRIIQSNYTWMPPKNSSPQLPKINYANISSNNQITPPSSPVSDSEFSDDGYSVFYLREMHLQQAAPNFSRFAAMSRNFADVSEFPLPDDIHPEPAPEPEPSPIVQASTSAGGETVTRRKPTPAPRMLKPNSMYLPPLPTAAVRASSGGGPPPPSMSPPQTVASSCGGGPLPPPMGGPPKATFEAPHKNSLPKGGGGGDPRDALLESIRGGVKLKKVDKKATERKPPAMDFLTELKITLRRTKNPAVNPYAAPDEQSGDELFA